MAGCVEMHVIFVIAIRAGAKRGAKDTAGALMRLAHRLVETAQHLDDLARGEAKAGNIHRLAAPMF